ncbi:MAG: SoxR reducing system RseC family protein [Zoogloeaceae bacterium]|jgi:positive regulator of sigma E activity|nr:SoxR reducing system RseC family protein [Zoogloeaceae bacterium]
MNESEAIVQRLDGDYVWLDIQSACAGCGKAGNCGLSASRVKRLQRFRNEIGARAGDTVILSMPAGSVLKAVLHCYLLPLLLAIMLAAGGMAIAREPGAVSGMAVGLLLGWYHLRRSGQRQPQPAMRLKTSVIDLHKRLPL